MKKNCLIYLLVLFCHTLLAQDLQYSVHHYSVADGLPQNTVRAILEDRDGFMWIGTWDGLCRYDGNVFKTYKPSFSGARIASNRIDFIYEDALGFIWARTYDGAFYRLNKHTETILPTEIHDARFGNRLPIKNLLLEQIPGVVWLSGDTQLLRVEENDKRGKSDQTKQTLFSLHGYANFLLCDEQGTVWAGTNNGIEHFADEQSCYFPGTSAEENYFTTGIVMGNDLWLGTDAGVLWHYVAENQRFERARMAVSSAITGVEMLDESCLIITTEADGVVVYNHQNGEHQQFSVANTKGLTSNLFEAPYVEKTGVAWLLNHQKGVWRYDHASGSLRHYMPEIDIRYQDQLGNNFFACYDTEGHIWVNPNGGGFSYYDEEQDKLLSPLGGCTNMVHSAMIDKRGSIWLGTCDLGLDRVDVSPVHFHLNDIRNQSGVASEVRSFLLLRDGTLLLGTKDFMVHRVKAKGEVLSKERLPQRVYAMLEAADGTMLYGTRGAGLIVRNGKQEFRYAHEENNPASLSCSDIYDLIYDADSTLYIATYGGGINIFRNGEFVHPSNKWNSYPTNFGEKVRDLALVNDTTIWAACTSGLLRVNTRTLATQQTAFFDIRNITQTPDGHVWLSTFGGGLVEVISPEKEEVLADDNIHQYTSKNGLISDIVLSTAAMPDGDLWFVFEEGVSHYDLQSQTFQHFMVLSPDMHASFGEAEAQVFPTGEVLFGYSSGFCWFAPNEIFHSKEFPRLQFTDFIVGNQSAKIGSGSPLNDNINCVEKIDLRHNQNVFTIYYTAIDYANAEHFMYAIKMDGLDRDWKYVDHLRAATYTNLSPGDYTFHVRSTNAQGLWGDNERTIQIHVHASFWASPFAWTIYLVLLIMLLWLLVHNFRTGNQLRQEMMVEQKVTDIKLRFFTNISHELRTPLTLITGPVENILHNEHISNEVRTQLEIVSSNASRMLRLINHILDFRKIQNQKMRLRVQESNLNILSEATFANFTKEAADKHVAFSFEPSPAPVLAWVDRERVDTIIYNLLSNAFKFTPSGKSITLRVKDTPNYAIVEVADTGIGIPKDKRAVLFERFASNNEINASANKQGTGIGLNLVKELVDLHHGYIEVDSEPGKGATFTVLFKHGRDHFQQDVDIIYDDTNSPVEQLVSEEQEAENATPQDPNLHTLLVVDDNDDMRVFLHSILAAEYNVLTAADGAEALRISGANSIDLVVTDLMMPNMDGLELTQRLKSAIETSHIPVLLLTAKSAIESRLQALEYGADDYITKPFSPEYLLARIDNVLRQRKRLQENYRHMLILPTEVAKEEVVKTPNDIFLERLYTYMLQNLDNNALTVEDMVREMALGRTVFFNKLKSLTGLSPVEYIRDIRIRRAAEMLLDPNYNITEVTYMVGMNDSRYFSKCFKAVYGVTPSEYKKKNGQIPPRS